MRQAFSEFVERGRELSGPCASAPGDRFGVFRLKHSGAGSTAFVVMVSDGADWAECGLDGPAWEHVSVSTKARCPTWGEMCYFADLFFEPHECLVQFRPPALEYVNDHDFCLHLWRLVGAEVPRPPALCVGYGRRAAGSVSRGVDELLASLPPGRKCPKCAGMMIHERLTGYRCFRGCQQP